MSSLQQFCEPTLAPAAPVVAVKTPRWYAIHTRARHEKKVAHQLQDKGVSTFLPLIDQVHRWSGRRVLVQLPLFSCYIFVRMVASVEACLAVLQTPGVLGFVGIRGVGIAIPEKEIEDIKTLLAREVACMPHSFLKVGRRVRIRGGCFDGVEGILVGTNGDRSLVVSIELIQRSLAVRIDGYDVEAI
jgi:transcription antitermination factor NusG